MVEAAIEALGQSIAELDDTLSRRVHSSPTIKQMVERLVTAPGIGPVASLDGEHDRFKSRYQNNTVA